MEFQNTDEAVRKEACEKVKQIVKAIKAIKIKYYLNFSKISTKDQEIYQKLEANLESITKTHNLNNLRVALMQEVEVKYNGKNPDDMNQDEEPEPEDILQACYGAVDAQVDALSRGRITQARRCQEQLKKYRQRLGIVGDKEIENYKREKFAELSRTRELGITLSQLKNQQEEWLDKNNIRDMFKIKDAKEREKITQIIGSMINNRKLHTREENQECELIND